MTIIYRDNIGYVQQDGVSTVQILEGKAYINGDDVSIVINLDQLVGAEQE